MKHALLLTVFCLLACNQPSGPGTKVELGTAEQDKTVKVSVQVTGLLGAGLTLKLNGVGDLNIAADGSYPFPVSLEVGADYLVTVFRQPLLPVQVCEVQTASGTAGTDDLLLGVSCTTSKFALGGTVSGLVGSGLALGIAGQTVTVAANGMFTFNEGVADLTDYQVQVVTQPSEPAQICLLQNAIGRLVGKAVETLRVECRTTVQPAFVNGAGWNDYVTTSGSFSETPDTAPACDASAQASYGACLHGGEARSLVVYGRTSCDGLRASDALAAFEWSCQDQDEGDPANPVRVVSRRLLPGKSLRDLIDAPSLSFKTNVVTVVDGAGATVAVSAVAPWWQTPILQGGAPQTAGTIQLVTGTSAVSVEADRVAVVADLSASISVINRAFVWIDGAVSAAGASDGVLVQNARFVVLRGLSVEQATAANVHVVGGAAHAFFDLVTTGAASGLDVDGAGGLVGERIVALRNQQNGVRLNAVHASRFEALQAIAGGTGSVGVSLVGSQNNDLSAVRTNNHIGTGIAFNTSDFNRVTQLTSSNNAGALVMFTNANGNWLSGVSAVLGPTGFISTGSQGNVIEQAVTIANERFVSCNTGSITFLDHLSFPATQLGDCVIGVNGPTAPTNNGPFQASFIGPVGTNDAVNNSDINGVAGVSGVSGFDVLNAAPRDWYSFRNTFRAWGPSTPSSFLHAVQHRECSAGNCRIYDWSLKPSAVDLLRGKFPAPVAADARVHTWINADASACAAIPGAVFGTSCTSTYLPHAFERMGDGIGNDNSLCESNETCVIAQNIASYQGFGTGAVTTIGAGGTVELITLVAPANNDGTQP